jgi:NADPH:quinone reductase-like Zn-dependent oxidoreductase
MKAVIINAYGGTGVLHIADIPRPSCGPGEVLVRVRAAAVNPKDTFIRKGRFKQFTGDPGSVRMGFDFAGEVAEIGEGVKDVQVGKCVYGMLDGWQGGALAEYLAVSGGKVAQMPGSLTFNEAAALPLVSLTALQALRDEAQIKAGQSLCINGASGGVGSMAVQIGKIFGAEVTGIGRTDNHDFLMKLGADHCLDYRAVDISKQSRRYDIFFDVFGNQPFKEIAPILTERGIWVSTVLKQHVYESVARSKISGGKKAKMIIVRSSRADLERISGWIASGQLQPIIQGIFPLDRIEEAQAQQETKHSRGKIVVSIADRQQ